MPLPGNERMMTATEVARVLHTHPSTIRRYAERGILRAVRTPGGHRRYRVADVEAAHAAAQR
ncbi:MAG: hypothetical protein ABS81_14590 [Pseudonocardia sp. SCN 72-86]|nr:MAG: hypothetical protein ABS81_14590 [Pseudonocardia sp. SCN 72-86]